MWICAEPEIENIFFPRLSVTHVGSINEKNGKSKISLGCPFK